MKILDSSSPEMRAIQRVSSINDEIRRLCGTTGLDQAHAELLLTTELKERIEWVDTLQSLEQAFDERAAIFEAVKEKMQAHNSGFQKFQLLPRELRYKIVMSLSHYCIPKHSKHFLTCPDMFRPPLPYPSYLAKHVVNSSSGSFLWKHICVLAFIVWRERAGDGSQIMRFRLYCMLASNHESHISSHQTRLSCSRHTSILTSIPFICHS